MPNSFAPKSCRRLWNNFTRSRGLRPPIPRVSVWFRCQSRIEYGPPTHVATSRGPVSPTRGFWESERHNNLFGTELMDWMFGGQHGNDFWGGGGGDLMEDAQADIYHYNSYLDSPAANPDLINNFNFLAGDRIDFTQIFRAEQNDPLTAGLPLGFPCYRGEGCVRELLFASADLSFLKFPKWSSS